MDNQLFQVSLLPALMLGHYEGVITVGELRKHGDTGLGTFDGLNGEMIIYRGKVYRVAGSGHVEEADDKETVPFANTAFFHPSMREELTDLNHLDDVKAAVTRMLQPEGMNSFYMMELNGDFSEVKTRSEWKQNKPYRPLDEAMKTDQTEFERENVTGTVIGLFCPAFVQGMNMPGWHFHFLSSDKTFGGHVMDLSLRKGTVILQKLNGFTLHLPDTEDFQKLNLAEDLSERINMVE
jgi:acetolactate decarboxylase